MPDQRDSAAQREELPLTQSHVRYLLALWTLTGEENRGARITDLSGVLGVSKPSVHRMVRRLSEMELVTFAPRGRVYLTKRGKGAAQRSQAQLEKLGCMLESRLELRGDRARLAALALLEYLPEQPETRDTR